MKVKVSDYIANFFVEKGITDVFTVVGGGAMHMNDSFGHHYRMHCFYNHHEQASAMAAEAYARVNNKMALVCVTSGPGAINALNGVVGAYQQENPNDYRYFLIYLLCKFLSRLFQYKILEYQLEYLTSMAQAFHLSLSGKLSPNNKVSV